VQELPPALPDVLPVAQEFLPVVREFLHDGGRAATIVSMSSHCALLALLFTELGCATYLEIGVATGASFGAVPARRKVGVDPSPRAAAVEGVRLMTSDSFFAENRERFDFCFVDGYHSFDQALRDTWNALEVADTVVLHDTIPPSAATATPQPIPGGWHGEVWKVCEYFRRVGATYFTVDDAYGLTVVRAQGIPRDEAHIAAVAALDFDYYAARRDEIVNPVPVSDVPAWLRRSLHRPAIR
jgi:predicted O-methyltransferase YrrM